MKTAHRCCRIIYHGTREPAQCSKMAKIERDGRWYCGTHDPVAVEEKRETRYKIRAEEVEKDRRFRESVIAEQKEIERKAALHDELLEALEEIKEYWNRDTNEQAIIDALWHMINTAAEAIDKAKGETL